MRPLLALLAAALAAPVAATDGVPRPSAPLVAVLVADQGPFDAHPVPWWAPGKGATAPTRAGDGAVAAAFGDGSVRLLEPAPRAGRLATLGVGCAPLAPGRAREVARLLGADVLVHGAAVATDEEDSGGVLEQASGMKGSSTGRPCSVTVSLRAHRADTGRPIAEAVGTGRSTAHRPTDCTRTATAKAVQAATPELRARILTYWRERPGS
jgi:hypothetical protein